jgi:hypothetical protein
MVLYQRGDAPSATSSKTRALWRTDTTRVPTTYTYMYMSHRGKNTHKGTVNWQVAASRKIKRLVSPRGSDIVERVICDLAQVGICMSGQWREAHIPGACRWAWSRQTGGSKSQAPVSSKNVGDPKASRARSLHWRHTSLAVTSTASAAWPRSAP